MFCPPSHIFGIHNPQDESGTVHLGLGCVLRCWRAEGHNLEGIDRQTAQQGAEVLAFEALIDQTLLPAVTRYLWLDDKNYESVTYRAVAPQLPFPFSLVRFVVPSPDSPRSDFTCRQGYME